MPKSKRAKNRVHLDLMNPDPSVIDELVRLGATVVGDHEVPGAKPSLDCDAGPGGNEFCIAAKSFTGWDCLRRLACLAMIADVADVDQLSGRVVGAEQ